MRAALVLIAVLCSACLVSAEEIAPEAGETKLSTADADKQLAALAEKFKANPAIKAGIVTEVDDLLGKRTEEGELLLDRPGRVLRKFTKPSLKIWLLNGAEIQEFASKQKTLYVKDFSKAPKTLALIQAAVTIDTKALGSLFDFQVFRAEKDGHAALRLVLTKKPGGENSLLYKRITARIGAGDLFFKSIEYVPESGDTMIEKYQQIQAAKPADADFKLDLPADTTRKVENIGDAQAK